MFGGGYCTVGWAIIGVDIVELGGPLLGWILYSWVDVVQFGGLFLGWILYSWVGRVGGGYCTVWWFIDTFILFPMNFKTQIIIPKGLKVT